MKNIISYITVLVLIIVSFTSCSSVKNNKDIPLPFHAETYGGDSNANFYRQCNAFMMGIPYELIKTVGVDEFDKWVEDINSTKYATDLDKFENMYSFIKHFNIKKDIVEEYYINMLNNNKTNDYTKSDINCLLCNEKNTIAEHFVSEYAVYSNGNIYTPEWFYYSPLEEYERNKISKEIVEQKATKYLNEFRFTEDAFYYFKNKIEKYIGSELNVSFTYEIDKEDKIESDYSVLDDDNEVYTIDDSENEIDSKDAEILD